MSSSESHYAWRAARFYGPQRVQMTRRERIVWLSEQIAQLEHAEHEHWAAHRVSCVECQSDGFCLDSMTVTPEDRERRDRVQFMRGLIESEKRDEAYAQRAQVHPVEYKQHIDGFCSYWQNVRHRKFESVGYKCERCGGNGPLDAHHLHYDTLGFEELGDLQALCRCCHESADHGRAASARYSAAMSTYLTKKYGDDGDVPEGADEEFAEWFESKQEEDY